MNKVLLIGNIASDIEKRDTQSGIPVARFRVAVQRAYKSQDGKREADFFPCECWRKTAEFAAQYTHKGDKIALVGNVQNRTYKDKNEVERTITEVVVDELEVVKYKEAQPAQEQREQQNKFTETVEDDDFPF